jgi:hypothetical protein
MIFQLLHRVDPNVVRLEDTTCRTRERTVHHVHGLAPGVIAAIIFVGQRPLEPRFGARELCHWEHLAACHPASSPVRPPGVLRASARSVPGGGSRVPVISHEAGNQRVVRHADAVCLRHTVSAPTNSVAARRKDRRARPASWAAESSTTRPPAVEYGYEQVFADPDGA